MTSQQDKLNLITAAFDFLRERGYEVMGRDFDRPYGDVAVTFRAPDCHLKIATDRGEVYVYIALNPLVERCWFDLGSMAAYLASSVGLAREDEAAIPFARIENPQAVQALADALRHHLPAIERLFRQCEAEPLCEELRSFAYYRFKALAELPTPCDRFSTQVQEWFAFLFHEHGFAIVHEDRPSKYHCLLGLESNLCRLQIYRTEEEGNIWIARRDAPFGWTAHTRKDGSRRSGRERVDGRASRPTKEALVDSNPHNEAPRIRGVEQWIFHCDSCGYEDVTYNLTDMGGYGRSLGRTRQGELAELSAWEPEPSAYVEVIDLLRVVIGRDNHTLLRDCRDRLFGLVADPAPSGERYNFRRHLCYRCGGNVKLIRTGDPWDVAIPLPLATHRQWDSLSRDGKIALIEEALRSWQVF